MVTEGREGEWGNSIHPEPPAFVVNTSLQGLLLVRVLNHHTSSAGKSKGNKGSVPFVSQ